MLKQQDMTETARVVFNELSVTEPATVGEIAQNTYLSRERCQLIPSLLWRVWQIISSVVTDAFLSEGFFICGNGRLVGVSGTCQPSAHALGSQANLRPICFAQKRYEPIREVLIDLWLIL